ncbi:GNAT family N-acetyltransferase [Modicisalibacter radicis]|uniref:GNAT family N-acetyltransferase n=1 Tax=Halomonas sp. EAR18 TaxID=2518972 RepID=UPI00109BF611|nr:GNAT family N-acetyltransferase [Halomonas sp. EAR18]
MSISLKSAEGRDLDEVLAHVRAYHQYENVRLSDEQRVSAIRQLLGPSQLGQIYLVHHSTTVVGYIAVCFGFSIEFEGRDAFIDEMYIALTYRNKGYGREALDTLKLVMRSMDVKALHLEVDRGNEKAQRLYSAVGFESREKYFLMSSVLTDPEAQQGAQEGPPPSSVAP